MNKCIVRKCNGYPLKGFRKCADCVNPKCIECNKPISKKGNLCYTCKIEAQKRSEEE